jgi:hypothetical protein
MNPGVISSSSRNDLSVVVLYKMVVTCGYLKNTAVLELRLLLQE